MKWTCVRCGDQNTMVFVEAKDTAADNIHIELGQVRGDEYNNFLCARTKGILCALAFVVVFFYTYTGIIGTNFAFLDIGSFFAGVFLGEYVTFKQMKKNGKCNKFIAISVLTVLLFCFMFFTYNTPHIGLFIDPVSGGYGIGY